MSTIATNENGEEEEVEEQEQEESDSIRIDVHDHYRAPLIFEDDGDDEQDETYRGPSLLTLPSPATYDKSPHTSLSDSSPSSNVLSLCSGACISTTTPTSYNPTEEDKDEEEEEEEEPKGRISSYPCRLSPFFDDLLLSFQYFESFLCRITKSAAVAAGAPNYKWSLLWTITSPSTLFSHFTFSRSRSPLPQPLSYVSSLGTIKNKSATEVFHDCDGDDDERVGAILHEGVTFSGKNLIDPITAVASEDEYFDYIFTDDDNDNDHDSCCSDSDNSIDQNDDDNHSNDKITIVDAIHKAEEMETDSCCQHSTTSIASLSTSILPNFVKARLYSGTPTPTTEDATDAITRICNGEPIYNANANANANVTTPVGVTATSDAYSKAPSSDGGCVGRQKKPHQSLRLAELKSLRRRILRIKTKDDISLLGKPLINQSSRSISSEPGSVDGGVSQMVDATDAVVVVASGSSSRNNVDSDMKNNNFNHNEKEASALLQTINKTETILAAASETTDVGGAIWTESTPIPPKISVTTAETKVACFRGDLDNDSSAICPETPILSKIFVTNAETNTNDNQQSSSMKSLSEKKEAEEEETEEEEVDEKADSVIQGVSLLVGSIDNLHHDNNSSNRSLFVGGVVHNYNHNVFVLAKGTMMPRRSPGARKLLNGG